MNAVPLMAQEKPAAPANAPVPAETIKIWQEGEWKGELPGGWKVEGPEEAKVTEHMGGTLTIRNVSEPVLAYFKPAAEKARRKAVIVCPGGGYNILAWDLEGTEIAAFLSARGYHGFVLKYRLPKDSGPRHAAALQDAQRAVSLVRSRAEALGIAPDGIGIMGFSAGAHLSAMASTQYGTRTYPAKDAIDAVSCRPDFTVLIYAAYLLADDKNPGAGGLSADLAVNAETPPAFLAHTLDDPLPWNGALAWMNGLKKYNVPAELHLYPAGGHGYGLRSDQSVKHWPGALLDWLGNEPKDAKEGK